MEEEMRNGHIPINRTAKANKTVVTPRGRANLWTRLVMADNCTGALADREVMSAIVKSCTRATPIEASASEVRTYARKVRSEARWSRAVEPEFRSVRRGEGMPMGRMRCMRPGDGMPVGDA